ncbi:EthD domain-containing protein [Pseudomonas sp. HR96]|uniref:EthD domain-containing protein n=1 Tax=Pseudomonas sp. HR96 TaxID=1027966 RepID=UPI002A74B692|nr:EthD domain-containing protein [Pseudomonas sp. HR96]WPP01418.1 EthD domain-containing protein [Pseudomonas sp. HR96]
MITLNSYTTVKRRERVPHEVFAHYWRDVHGPLCARLPGLGLYIQHHFERNQDAHLWPLADGISEIADYELDGGVEIGFSSADDQQRFKAASPILFSDEQNMFDETLAYDLPQGSSTLVNHCADQTHNGPDRLDRIHLHLSAKNTLDDLHGYLQGDFSRLLSAAPGLMKLQLHLCAPFVNDGQRPPSPGVAHTASADRQQLAVVEVAFASPMQRRQFFASGAFLDSQAQQAVHIASLKAFAVSGVYTYVRDGQLTTAGLRGSRAAELIDYLGALNQIEPEVAALMHSGKLAE